MSFRVSITPVEFLESALNSATADPVAALQLAKKREQSIFLEMNQHVQVLTKKHGEEMLKAKNHVTALDIDNMMLRQENEQLEQENEQLLQENERLRLQLARYVVDK
jgi:predicted RNase H-like nuclease (RuvC/YqgF family)